jgi:hypothetical protein
MLFSKMEELILEDLYCKREHLNRQILWKAKKSSRINIENQALKDLNQRKLINLSKNNSKKNSKNGKSKSNGIKVAVEDSYRQNPWSNLSRVEDNHSK